MTVLLYWIVEIGLVALIALFALLAVIIKAFTFGAGGEYHDEELIETIDVINGILEEYEVGDYISKKMCDNEYEYCEIVDIVFGKYTWKSFFNHVKVIKKPQMIVQPLACKYFNTCTNIADDERDIVCFTERDGLFKRPDSDLTIYMPNSAYSPRRRERDDVIERREYCIKKVDIDQMRQLLKAAE